MKSYKPHALYFASVLLTLIFSCTKGENFIVPPERENYLGCWYNSKCQSFCLLDSNIFTYDSVPQNTSNALLYGFYDVIKPSKFGGLTTKGFYLLDSSHTKNGSIQIDDKDNLKIELNYKQLGVFLKNCGL